MWAVADLAPMRAQAQLPDAPGKDAVKKICGECHEVEAVIGARRTRIGWEQTIDDMVSRGAEGTDEEMAAVLAYLTASFGKVNVNTAPAAELEKALALSAKEAQALLSYREKNGKYKNFEELLKTPGLNPEKLREKRNLVAFSQ